MEEFKAFKKDTADFYNACINFRNAIRKYLALLEFSEKEIIRRLYSELHRKKKNFAAQKELLDFMQKEQDQQEEIAFVEGALYTIFRIRNNMLHGGKDEYTLNQQVDIFIYGTEMLAYMLEHPMTFELEGIDENKIQN